MVSSCVRDRAEPSISAVDSAVMEVVMEVVRGSTHM